MLLKNIPKRKLLLLFGDIIIILFSLNLALIIRFGHLSDFGYWINKPIILLIVIISYVLSFYIFNLFDIQTKFLRTQSIVLFLCALLSVALIIAIFFYLFPFGMGRGIFFISFLFIGILAFLWRIFFNMLFIVAIPKKKILIVGAESRKQVFSLLTHDNPEYKVAGFLSDFPHKRNPNSSLSYLGNIASLEKVVEEYGIDDIVVAREAGKNKELKRALVNCRLKGVRIFDLSTLYENVVNKIPVLYTKDQWFLYCQGFDGLGSAVYRNIKRSFDFVVSFSLLVALSPLVVLISLLIKLTSKGPVFYIQERLGENEKQYKMYKFRSMFADAEKDEPKWASENDERVTLMGKVLRKTRLDELPQLINVLKGEMSLIGPRPEREYFIRILREKIPYYSLRFAVKPGITGWAQVNYRYGATIDDAVEKVCYDLYYIKNMSFFLDLRILLKTIRVCLFGVGWR